MFEMNFFATFLFFSMLIITSVGIEIPGEKDLSKECSLNKTFYLVTARSGLKFYKKESFFGSVEITYDCSLGHSFEGTIDLNDDEHPRFIDSLLIKNCRNVTVILGGCEHNIKSLQITDGREVEIKTFEESNDPAEIVITDVEVLKWTSKYYDYRGRYCFHKRDRSLTLKNVVIKNFKYNSFNNLYMTGVVAESFEADRLSGSLLNITDSHFGLLKSNSFIGNVVQAYFVNNTFERVLRGSFDLLVNESFVFSDNYVKKILGSIRVTSPTVEIVGNAFDYGNDTFFITELLDPNFDENTFVFLNVSSNRVKSFDNNLVELTDSSKPDLIIIERNQFNCSCKTSLYLEKLVKSSSERITTKLLLDRNNICFNFEDCPLRKLLGNDIKVCTDVFVCPEDSSEVSDITLKRISHEILKNLTEALHLYMGQNQKFKYSDKTPTENIVNSF